ncbi:MAG: YraN family protein [Planctomycetes bacterium]|nr:YraN family protein [Planctomycetota bacterium]
MTKNNKQLLGATGEELALKHLKKNGYRIIERNFRTKLGEIDIIGYNEKTICFVEVKTRSSDEFGIPEESVIKHKQKQIINTARYYLMRKKISPETPCRFDVVAITLKEPVIGAIEIHLIKNAFSRG